MTLAPKTRLGTYEIVDLLGTGGMGDVYRAKDLRLGREVALKMLPAEVSDSSDRLLRFEREARLIARLNHPNIVTLHSVEDVDGMRFLTMELVEGQTLSTLITPGGLPLVRLLELAIPLTDALTAAHDRGVIHRDLKPRNIMVTRDGRIKVLDFGLAKMMGRDAVEPDASTGTRADAPLTEEGHVVGTVPYMAPEHLQGEPAQAESDLFAIGVILYELATGRRPFRGKTTMDVISSILRDTPESLRRIRADVPDGLDRLVSRCLEKNPRKRIRSALDIGNELRRIRNRIGDTGQAGPASDKIASIAVLPFANRSASADDEYFSDGLADELLNVLAKIRGLRVTARTSSFHFKGKDKTIAEIGKALDVATVLEGSVRRAASRIRVSVQLVNVMDSSHLWSETYDRTLEDIFAVQDDIAQSVVKELRATLLGEDPDGVASRHVEAEVASASRGRTTNPEAHRLYLVARHLIDRFTREDTAKAVERLKEALALDPEFALAWKELGRAYSIQASVGWIPASEIEQSREAARHALALEPDLAEGHAEMGWIQSVYDRDFRAAETSLARALELAPGNAAVLRAAGLLAKNLGRLEEALDRNRRALEADPLSPAAYNNLALTLHDANRFEEAEIALRKALELAPRMTGPHSLLSLALLAQGRCAEALAEATLETEEVFRLMALAIVHHGRGDRAESDAALAALIQKYAGGAACQIADVHAARGEVNAAFDWLERAYAQQDGGLVDVKTNRSFRSLHGDPRWGVFLKKLGHED